MQTRSISECSETSSAAGTREPDERPSGTEYIVGLDLLRFVCAAGVTFFHLAFASWTPGRLFPANVEGSAAPDTLASISSFGWVGVQIFFVISGFVIAATAKSGGPGRFVWSRLQRLYPAAIACATLTLLALILSQPGRSWGLMALWAKTLTLFPVPASVWIDPVYWTLAVEIAFYFIVFLALWLLGTKAVFPVIALLGAFSAFSQIAPPVLEAMHLRDIAQASSDLATSGILGVSTLALLLQYGAHFAVGAAIWALRDRGVSLVGLGILVIGLSGALAQVLAEDHRREMLGYYPVDQTAGSVAIYLFVITLIVLSVYFNEVAFRFLGKRQIFALRYLGLLTYPLYLLHNYVGVAIIRAMLALGLTPIAAIPIAHLATLLLLIGVLTFFERPLQSFLRDKGAKLQKSIEATSPLAVSPTWRRLVEGTVR